MFLKLYIVQNICFIKLYSLIYNTFLGISCMLFQNNICTYFIISIVEIILLLTLVYNMDN